MKFTQFMGSFQCTSGKMIITDPCIFPEYQQSVRVNTGNWNVYIKGKLAILRAYPEELVILHNSIKIDEIERLEKVQDIWKRIFKVNVDSASVCCFDSLAYGNDEMNAEIMGETPDRNNPGKVWIERYKWILNSERAGIMPGGVVSYTCYGDGSFPCYKFIKDGKVIGLRIFLI